MGGEENKTKLRLHFVHFFKNAVEVLFIRGEGAFPNMTYDFFFKSV